MGTASQALRPITNSTTNFARSTSTPLLPVVSSEQPREPWLSISEQGFHASTGRRCFLDPTTMRMEWAPVTTADKWTLSNQMTKHMDRAMTASHPQLGGL